MVLKKAEYLIEIDEEARRRLRTLEDARDVERQGAQAEASRALCEPTAERDRKVAALRRAHDDAMSKLGAAEIAEVAKVTRETRGRYASQRATLEAGYQKAKAEAHAPVDEIAKDAAQALTRRLCEIDVKFNEESAKLARWRDAACAEARAKADAEAAVKAEAAVTEAAAAPAP